MKNKISIILPTYNEVENIHLVIKEITDELTNRDYEIIVVDDDSPDGTSELVAHLKKEYSRLRLLTRTSNKGLVPSIRDGISFADGDICVWMDADMSMSPKIINNFIDIIEDGADLVLGSRYIDGGGMKGSHPNGEKTSTYTLWKNLITSEDSFLSAIISKFGNITIRLILQVNLHDFSSGFFGARKKTLESLGIDGGIVDYCISLPYRAILKEYKVVEIPMILDTRKFGKSKTSNTIIEILKIGIQCIRTAITLKFAVQDERVMVKMIRDNL